MRDPGGNRGLCVMTGSFGRHRRCVRVACWVSLSAGCLAIGACANNANNNVASRSSANRDIATGAPESERVAKAAPATIKRRATAATSSVIQASGAYSTIGVASWYGADFHGRRTANGETYDMHSLTAAHPTLPLHSHVRVTNLTNHRSLVLRVNDRGPYVGQRVIDVSAQSAKLLGFYDRGLAKVKVDYIGRAPAPAAGTRATASAAPL